MIMRIASMHVLQVPYESNDGDRRSECTSSEWFDIVRWSGADSYTVIRKKLGFQRGKEFDNRMRVTREVQL
jgi:hypothetical protein